VLRGIQVYRRVPGEITARVPFAVVIEIRNPHQRKVSYSLGISDGGDFFPRRTLGYVASLAPGESRSFHYLVCTEKRGVHRFGPIHLITRFPFGLFEKARIVPAEENVIVYPGITETPKLPDLAWGKNHPGSRKWRWGEEISGLRAAVPEDDHRFIHWRTSARMGQLMVKEFVEELEHPRPVFFDHRGEEGETFEQAVELTATLLRALVRRGVIVTFGTWDEYFPRIATIDDMKSVLRHLALISPFRESHGAGFERWQKEAARLGGGVFVQAGLFSPPPTLTCAVVRV